MSGERDVTPLFDAGGRCLLCTSRGKSKAFQQAHAQVHLADGSAIVVIRDGRDAVRPTYEMDDDPDPDGLTGDARARRAVEKAFAQKHKSVRIPKGMRPWKRP